MEEQNEIIVAEVVQLGTIAASGPSDVISRASLVATELAKVVDSRNLFSLISGKKFVKVEGWNTLGAMLGILPREKYVNPIENGYEAYVELIRANDGVVIGGASAICTRDERNWQNRDDFALRSMTITRATGKAFRLGFSWIMALAGYEPTPAEEMTDFTTTGTTSKAVQRPAGTEAPKSSKRETEKPGGPVGVLMDLGVDNTSHAAALATKLKLTSKMSKAEIEELYSKYENLKASGKSSDEAAQELVG